MTLTWWRLEMDAPAELEESLLWKLQTLGVGRVAIQSHPDTPEQHRLVAWLPEIDWPAPQRAELERALAALGEPFDLVLPPLDWHRQDEEDWSLSWKQHWQADPIGERLLILPAWLEVPPEFGQRLVIRIDPGSAFGTGSHPTTRLCLEAMERLAMQDPGAGSLAGWRVADLGCGSGILGFGALRLGAAALAASDTDPLAVRATAENAALNGLPLAPGGVVRVAEGSVEALEALLEGVPANLLLCNILAPVIEALCPAFDRLLAADGVGLLSGLLVEQVPALEDALAGAGWQAELTASQSQWGLLTIRRRPDVA
ncbi:50S ribosomal protein L11 methyltransferase [Synechococcus sp. CCY9202]|uniref:50S ribosomal protein L11 methyltransferase n=1 Tax=Synechococcus sp. CCY9202 TaxID=174698 RepID=UPI002B1F6FCE|nr:50S ribosomal protein L11 methyltransferase [Synechococcus sp. CCY9202]MEA5421611.1 50S ribosomal protein L11 methyltransferase [Synechococcus sp. CCY9202]